MRWPIQGFEPVARSPRSAALTSSGHMAPARRPRAMALAIPAPPTRFQPPARSARGHHTRDSAEAQLVIAFAGLAVTGIGCRSDLDRT